MHSPERIDLSAKVEQVKRKTRPWKAIIALVLAIAAAVISDSARHDSSLLFTASHRTYQFVRYATAALFLIFAVSLAPGLFGARLGDLDAFIPEGSAETVTAGDHAAPVGYFKNQLDAALAMARDQNKLVLVNFTGYACTNCHWMKANMFTRPEIQTVLKDFVIVDLYTDGTDAESEKNQKLEDERFGTASIPFYAILDKDQKVIATFPQLTRDPHQFLAFLESKPKVVL